MKLSKRLQDEKAFVVKQCGDSVICSRCGATLKTYVDECAADLSEMCPGFMTIEQAKEDFARSEGRP